MKLDKIDKTILELLQEDAKYTNKEIAAKLNLTTTPVFERIKRMEKDGVIKKYIALIDRVKIGYPLVAYCNVSLKEHSTKYLIRFEKDVQLLEEVVECYHIAGLFDYMLKVVIPDMETYQKFVAEKLAGLENIGRVQSAFVMNEVKHLYAFPIK